MTPSLNQGQFLEATIRSVLLQGYPDLEYSIIDGGSDDGSIDILHRYEPWLARWSSEPDDGQFDAINKGFTNTSGEILGWLNSDDMYFPDAFWRVGAIVTDLPGTVEWLTGVPAHWDEDDHLIQIGVSPSFPRSWLAAGYYEGRLLGWVQQEGTFWTRKLWQRTGGRVDETLEFAGDFELWRRFAAEASLYRVPAALGGFRFQAAQKTTRAPHAYYAEIDRVWGKARPWWFPLAQRSRTLSVLLDGYSERRAHCTRLRFDRDRGRWSTPGGC